MNKHVTPQTAAPVYQSPVAEHGVGGAAQQVAVSPWSGMGPEARPAVSSLPHVIEARLTRRPPRRVTASPVLRQMRLLAGNTAALGGVLWWLSFQNALLGLGPRQWSWFCIAPLIAWLIREARAAAQARLLRDGLPASALIVGRRVYEESSFTGQPVVSLSFEFATATGARVKRRLLLVEAIFSRPLLPGDTVTVLYDPRNPRRARLYPHFSDVALE